MYTTPAGRAMGGGCWLDRARAEAGLKLVRNTFTPRRHSAWHLQRHREVDLHHGDVLHAWRVLIPLWGDSKVDHHAGRGPSMTLAAEQGLRRGAGLSVQGVQDGSKTCPFYHLNLFQVESHTLEAQKHRASCL